MQRLERLTDEGARVRPGERKLVTTLFCDVVGSTALGERLDPELLETVQGAYFDRTQRVVEQHGGTVEKFIGDAVVAVFGVPLVHEDDALRALRCAFALREAIDGVNDTLRPRFGIELELRIGIATGEAIAGGGHALATGDVMNTAARIEQAAEPGEILVARDTALMTRDLVEYAAARPIAAKGKAARVDVWPAIGVARERRRARTPLVGREHELERLAAALEQVIREGEPQVLAVVGEPGIGKSRLAEEFAARAAGRAAVLRGDCLPYGEGTTWLPFSAIVAAEAGILDSDSDEAAFAKLRMSLASRHPMEEAALVEAQLAPLAGAARGSSSSGSEVLWALRRYVEALARARPAVLILDDLHWAHSLVLETLEELVATLQPVPLILVCQGRPELLERLGLVLVDRRTSVLQLEPLSHGEARALAVAIAKPAARDGVDDALVVRAAGNPLFIEELAALASEEPLSVAVVPQTLRALIAARLDVVPAEAKRVAQTAAVVGDVFWDGTVDAAVDGAEASVASSLRVLRVRGVVEEDPVSGFAGTRQFRFHHALTREVAYESLSKRERSRLHRAVARWLDERVDVHPELAVAVAYQLDSALSLAVEVAPLDDPEPAFVDATLSALVRAGEWATANAALSEAIALLRRAVAIPAANAALRDRATAQLAVALVRFGSLDEAADAARPVAETSRSADAAAHASFALAEISRNRGDTEGARNHGERALELAREAGLALLESEICDLLFWPYFWLGDLVTAEQRAMRAAEVAVAHGSLAHAARPLGFAGVSAMWRGDVALGDERVVEALRMVKESSSVSGLAGAHTPVSHIRRMQDRLDESVEHGRQAMRLHLEIGERFLAANACALAVAEPLIDARRYDDAWDALQDGLGLVESGSALAGPLRIRRAKVFLARGSVDEAEGELERVEPTRGYGYDDWHAVLAEIRAAQGRDAEAAALWRELLARLPKQQRLDEAELRLPFAAFLAQRGRFGDAERELEHIRALLRGTGAALLERELREVEASFAAA